MYKFLSLIYLAPFHIMLLLCVTSMGVSGQGIELNRPCQLTLKEGTLLNVYIIEDNEDYIKVRHAHLGEFKVPWEAIDHVINESDLFLQEDGLEEIYAASHYFISPSSYGLKKGQIYYENISVFFNSVSIGVTDRFSISVGAELATFLIGGQVPNFYLSPRFNLPIIKDKLGFSLSAIMFSNFSEGLNGGGYLQGALTLGSTKQHASLGIGSGYNTTDGLTNEQIIPITLSGTKRISNKLSLMLDNIYIYRPGFGRNYAWFSAGARFHFDNGSCINAGLFRLSEKFANIIGLPFVSAIIVIK